MSRPSSPASRRLRPRPWPALLLVALLFAVVSACSDRGAAQTAAAPGDVEFGDAEHGRGLFLDYGCGTCHQVSGLRGANGRVGPPLDDLPEQRMVAGVLPNTPEMLAAWIRDPQEHDPATGMPDVGVGVDDSADIAAFLLQR